MKNQPFTTAKRRHTEVVACLDSIIALLKDLKINSPVQDAVASAAKEYLTNHDLCRIFRVSKRTLQRYRQKGLITYYQINGKVYYKASEVNTFLQKIGKTDNL